MDNKKPNFLLTYAGEFPSVQLCAASQLEALAKEEKLSFRAMSYHKISARDLNRANCLILGRCDSWYERKLAKKAKQAGKYIFYLIDDDLLNVPENLLSAEHFSRKDIRKNIQEMISLSDGIISPSPVLLERYAPEGGRILVEEPAVLPAEYIPRDGASPVKIGFAGSLDRVDDIEAILKDALLRIKAEYGTQVEFGFFGAIPSFAQQLDAKTVPFCNSYETYLQTLNSLGWDIGLAPMPDTAFHSCKHYIKFIEYSAACIVGIYSHTGPYLRLSKWQDCALFSENTAEGWYQAIKELLDDPQKREQMRKNASRACRKDLNIHTVAADFYRQLCRCMEKPKNQKKIYFLKAPNKAAFFLVRVYYYLHHHRRSLLADLWRKIKPGK